MRSNQADNPTSHERLVVDNYQSSLSDYFIYLCHVATYEFARPFVSGRRVLDFGCGTGYGSHSLSTDAQSIIGIDISQDAISYAQNHYAAANLEYRRVGPVQNTPLPLPDDAFDVVCSFQVIEHVDGVEAYLSEIDRVLAPGGVFICATPNRLTRLFAKQRPWNVYHLYEYEPNELATLLQRHFDDVSLFGMTAEAKLVDVELARCRKGRIAAYPFTFPGAPEAWRRAGLGALKRLQRTKPAKSGSQPATDYGCDYTDIRIAADAEPSVNIVTVAHRRTR